MIPSVIVKPGSAQKGDSVPLLSSGPRWQSFLLITSLYIRAWDKHQRFELWFYRGIDQNQIKWLKWTPSLFQSSSLLKPLLETPSFIITITCSCLPLFSASSTEHHHPSQSASRSPSSCGTLFTNFHHFLLTILRHRHFLLVINRPTYL